MHRDSQQMAQVVNSEEPLLTNLCHDDILRFWLRWEIKDGPPMFPGYSRAREIASCLVVED